MNNNQTFSFELDDTDMDMINSHDTKFMNYNIPSNIKSTDNTTSSNSKRVSEKVKNTRLIYSHIQLHNTKLEKK